LIPNGIVLAGKQAVSLKIVQEKGMTLLRVAGTLEGEGVHVLENACADAAKPVALDLTELRTASQDGLDAIKRLEKAGARLVNVTPYIELRLKGRQ
jgi:hypothetical protein